MSDELQLPRLIDRRRGGFVAHQHVQAHKATVALVRKFDLAVVVHTRDIFDSVVSFRDHFRSGNFRNPLGFVPTTFHELDDEQQLRFTAALTAPWFLGFAKSWEFAESQGLRLVRSGYSDIAERADTTVRRTLDHYGFPIDERALSRARAAGPQNFNVGRTGRGLEVLPPDVVRTIRSIALNYRLRRPADLGL